MGEGDTIASRKGSHDERRNKAGEDDEGFVRVNLEMLSYFIGL